MALITCKECGSQISDKSTNCIKCGYPIVNNINVLKDNNLENASSDEPNGRKKKNLLDKNIIVVAVIIVLIVSIAIVGLSSGIGEENDPTYSVTTGQQNHEDIRNEVLDNSISNEEFDPAIYSESFISGTFEDKIGIFNSMLWLSYDAPTDLDTYRFIASPELEQEAQENLDKAGYTGNRLDDINAKAFFWADNNMTATVIMDGSSKILSSVALVNNNSVTLPEFVRLYQNIACVQSMCFFNGKYMKDNAGTLDPQFNVFTDMKNFTEISDNVWENECYITNDIYSKIVVSLSDANSPTALIITNFDN